MDKQSSVISEGSVVSFKEGYDHAKKQFRLMVEQMVKDLENEVGNRHMNDLEYGAYTKLQNVLDFIDDIK